MTSYNLRNISSTLCLPQPRIQIIKKKVFCTMDHPFGILFLRKLRRANLFLPFGRKSLLTLIVKVHATVHARVRLRNFRPLDIGSKINIGLNFVYGLRDPCLSSKQKWFVLNVKMFRCLGNFPCVRPSARLTSLQHTK